MAHQNAKIDEHSVVFLDTAGWLAMLNAKDALHLQAIKVRDDLQKRRVKLITTEFVLIEVADAFAAPPLRTLTVEFYKGLKRANTPDAVKIISVSEELLAKGWDFYSHRSDKKWGLSDCTSFVVMQEQGISEAFTSDHHFTQAGFSILLSHKP